VIGALADVVKQMVMEFYKRNGGKKPGAIIYYRDGVADSQFPIVLEYEYKAFRQVWVELGVLCVQVQCVLWYVEGISSVGTRPEVWVVVCSTDCFLRRCRKTAHVAASKKWCAHFPRQHSFLLSHSFCHAAPPPPSPPLPPGVCLPG